MPRLVFAAFLCGVSASWAVAAAANLGGLSTVQLGAGSGGVTACDADGVTTSYTTTSAKVTAVTVGGLADPACEGAVLSLTLVDSANASIGTGGPSAIPADGDTANNTQSLTIPAQPDAALVRGVHILVEGP